MCIRDRKLAVLLERQNYICVGYGIHPRCVQHLTADSPIDIDHIMPISRGGANTLENLAAMCPGCNRSKSDRTQSEWEAHMNDRYR